MSIQFHHVIRGHLVGPIWAPGEEAHKPLDYGLTLEERRYVGSLSLRDHVLAATNDGDFQHCEIADGELLTTVTVVRNGRPYIRRRSFPLTLFPSVADMVRVDWEGPDLDDSDD